MQNVFPAVAAIPLDPSDGIVSRFDFLDRAAPHRTKQPLIALLRCAPPDSKIRLNSSLSAALFHAPHRTEIPTTPASATPNPLHPNHRTGRRRTIRKGAEKTLIPLPTKPAHT